MSDKIENNKFTYNTQETQDINNLREHLSEALKILKNYNFTNEETGLKASINKRTIEKISSNKAIDKSTINKPYTKEEHFKVAENIGQIYENSILKETRTDRKNKPNIAKVHRFYMGIEVNGKDTISKITMFEKIEGKNQLYTIELNPTPKISCVLEKEVAKFAQHRTTTHNEAPHIANFDNESIAQNKSKNQPIKPKSKASKQKSKFNNFEMGM